MASEDASHVVDDSKLKLPTVTWEGERLSTGEEDETVVFKKYVLPSINQILFSLTGSLSTRPPIPLFPFPSPAAAASTASWTTK